MAANSTYHLAPFLLTNLLLESLKASDAARVLNITAPSTVRVKLDANAQKQLWQVSAELTELAAA